MECQQAGIVAEGQHSKYSDYQRGSGIVSKQGGGGVDTSAAERGIGKEGKGTLTFGGGIMKSGDRFTIGTSCDEE